MTAVLLPALISPNPNCPGRVSERISIFLLAGFPDFVLGTSVGLVLRAAARITIHRPCKARDVRTLAKLIKLLNSL